MLQQTIHIINLLKEVNTRDDSHLYYKLKFQSIGVSAIYDFNTNTPAKPYVGARLGINRVSLNSDESDPGFTYTEHSRKTKWVLVHWLV